MFKLLQTAHQANARAIEAVLASTSLASSLLTFVDFSWKLVTGAVGICQSGVSEENEHVQKVIDDLYELSDSIDTDRVPDTPQTRTLKRLAKECHGLSARLVQVLDKLKLSEEDRKSK